MVLVDQKNIYVYKGRKHSVFSAFMLLAKLIFSSLILSLFVINSVVAKDPVSVGVVNVTFIMENAPQADVASTALKEKFSPQEKRLAEDLDEINKLSTELRQASVSTELATVKRQQERELRSRKRSRSRALQDFREELRFARDAALDEVQKEVFSAIDAVRKQENIDIILQDYVSAAQRVDITPLVLGYLKKKLENSKAENTSLNETDAKNEN